MNKKTKSIVVKYNNWNNYDLALGTQGYNAPKLVMRALSRFIAKDARILDVGCGSGLAGRELKKLAPKCVLTGTDISSGMLDLAKKTKIYRKLVAADLNRKLPFGENSFDASACIGVFEYFKTLPAALRELSRVSQKFVAFYVLVTAKKGYYKHKKEDVFKALLACNLVPVEVFAFTAWDDHFAFGFIAQKLGRDSLKQGEYLGYKFYQATPLKKPL